MQDGLLTRQIYEINAQASKDSVRVSHKLLTIEFTAQIETSTHQNGLADYTSVLPCLNHWQPMAELILNSTPFVQPHHSEDAMLPTQRNWWWLHELTLPWLVQLCSFCLLSSAHWSRSWVSRCASLTAHDPFISVPISTDLPTPTCPYHLHSKLLYYSS